MAVEKYQITISKGKSRYSYNPRSEDFLGNFSHQEVRRLEKAVGVEHTIQTGSQFNPSNRQEFALNISSPEEERKYMGILQYLTADQGYVINKVERLEGDN